MDEFRNRLVKLPKVLPDGYQDFANYLTGVSPPAQRVFFNSLESDVRYLAVRDVVRLESFFISAPYKSCTVGDVLGRIKQAYDVDLSKCYLAANGQVLDSHAGIPLEVATIKAFCSSC